MGEVEFWTWLLKRLEIHTTWPQIESLCFHKFLITSIIHLNSCDSQLIKGNFHARGAHLRITPAHLRAEQGTLWFATCNSIIKWSFILPSQEPNFQINSASPLRLPHEDGLSNGIFPVTIFVSSSSIIISSPIESSVCLRKYTGPRCLFVHSVLVLSYQKPWNFVSFWDFQWNSKFPNFNHCGNYKSQDNVDFFFFFCWIS